MQKMMKKMKGRGMDKMMRGLGGMMGQGGPGGGLPPGGMPGMPGGGKRSPF